ncbi:MAG: transposase [Acidimicrobiia bacterium]
MQLLPGIGLVDLNHPELTDRLAGIAAEQLEAFQSRMRDGLLAASVAVGLGVLGEFLAAEVTEKAGPKGRHNPGRTAVRHGSEQTTVPLGGRRVPVDKPRLRAADGSGEIRLDTWDAVQAVDLLSEHMVAAALAGVSTRNYQHAALEAVGDVAARSTAKSTVSARFVAATRARLDELRNRDLSGRRWLVVYVDGFEFAGQTMIGALGVDADGTKCPLGIMQGTTENKTVCRDLPTKAVERGLDASAGLLFVLDGAKALHAAVRDVFDGQPVQIQRCRRHKSENIVGYLPAAEKGWVRRKLAAAWAEPEPAEARAALQELARKLDRLNPDAAGSLREGLEETITINRLGITGTLGRTLATTNPIESSIDIVRSHAKNVKNWNADRRGHRERPADMRLRRAAGRRAAIPPGQRPPTTPRPRRRSAAPNARPHRSRRIGSPPRPARVKFHGQLGNLFRRTG